MLGIGLGIWRSVLAGGSSGGGSGSLIFAKIMRKFAPFLLGVPVDQQVFTSSGTWTKPWSGTTALIECWGGGGGGGSSSNTTVVGPTGGGGGYVYKIVALSSLGATETVTIGAGGSGQAANNGTTATSGGNTTFGAHVTATGGTFGDFTAAVTGGTGGGGSGGVVLKGGDGLPYLSALTSASSPLMYAGPPGGMQMGITTAAPKSAVFPGGGGNTVSGTSHPGGNGAAGLCVVTVF